jgi:hypothetical protein
MIRKINFRAHILPLMVAAIFCTGLFSRCANIGQTGPQGGPKDSLPPRVVRMNPVFNATGLQQPMGIEIEFDEYIKLKDQQTEFYTSPFMPVKPTLSVKNRSVIVDVDLDEPLDAEQTYVFNLGSSVVDNNEGNPLHNLRYVFSTGGHIDSLHMSGFVSNVLTGDTVAGGTILFYDAALDTLPGGADSLLYDLRRASAVVRTLSHGGFEFGNLKPIDYRVYALKDANNNNMYDPGQDEVAFLDSTVNPAMLPPYLRWYDSTRMHVVAEPQIFFRTFVEKPVRRQNLSASTRNAAQQIVLKFSAPNPVIDTFTLTGIDPERILVENPNPGRDSLIYWLDIPADELPDTIRGRIAYQRSDSVGRLYRHGQDLRFVWKKPVAATPPAVKKPDTLAHDASPKEIKRFAKQERKRLKREAKIRAAFVADSLARAAADSIRLAADTTGLPLDSLAALADTVPPSKMKFGFAGDNPVIPGVAPVMTFELPVRRMEMEGVRFYTAGKDSVKTEIPFTLDRDSLRIREYALRSSEWRDGVSYTLTFPAGAIETIDGERSDSISHEFKVAVEKEMGTLDLLITGNPDSTEYIVEILDENRANVLREKAHIVGTDTIHYITPGKIAIRLTQDRNGNGRWDTGSLVERRQPEKVRWYRGAGGEVIELKAPELEFELEIDLETVFRDWVFTGSAGSEDDAETETEPTTGTDAPPAKTDEAPRISEKISSEARVEGFELTDPKAVKKAQKAARRAERQAKKEAGHDHD